MLLASAPLREWSLLSSRPTSRAHHRSLRHLDLTRRTKLIDHSPRIHCHCPTRSPAHPASIDWPRIHLFTWDPKQRRESVTCNLLQPTRNQSCTDIINQQLTCGPSALHLPIQLPHTKRCHSFQRRRNSSIYRELETTTTKWSLFNLYNIRMVQLTSGTRQTHL